MLDEEPTDDINGTVGTAEEKLSINFVKTKTKFCFSLHCRGDNIYLFVNGIETYKFKADNRKVNFATHVYLESISVNFGAVEAWEVSFKENLYDFTVNYDGIGKSDILNIQQHLMVTNNMK